MILPTSLEMVDFFYQCTNFSFSFHTLQHMPLRQIQTHTNAQHLNKTSSSVDARERGSFASYSPLAGLIWVGQGLKYNCRHMGN